MNLREALEKFEEFTCDMCSYPFELECDTCKLGEHASAVQEAAQEQAVALMQYFIGQCKTMAKENWTESQCQMLEWLFGAVLNEKKYDEYAEENMK